MLHCARCYARVRRCRGRSGGSHLRTRELRGAVIFVGDEDVSISVDVALSSHRFNFPDLAPRFQAPAALERCPPRVRRAGRPAGARLDGQRGIARRVPQARRHRHRRRIRHRPRATTTRRGCLSGKSSERRSRRSKRFSNLSISQGEEEAGARIRTADLLITNQLLYRLSYASVRSDVGPRDRPAQCVAIIGFPEVCPAVHCAVLARLARLPCRSVS